MGNLELTVVGVSTYDAAGEDANYRVMLRLRKLGGDTYDFTDSVFQVVDSNGAKYDHDTSCDRCPDSIVPSDGGFVLRSSNPAYKWVYFEITRAVTPAEFRFESSSLSAPSASIRLPSAPRPEVRATREATRIGSVEVRVLGIESFDATPYNPFNDENLRMQVSVRKVKGDEYDFSLNEWTLVTSQGTGIEWSGSCVDCPSNIDELILYGDQRITAYVYFEVPRGHHTFTEVRYEPFRSSSKGRILVDFTVTIR